MPPGVHFILPLIATAKTIQILTSWLIIKPDFIA
jgi:hypothetical protein